MIVTFAILGITVALFIFSRLRADLVALLSLLALFLTGVLTSKQALSGFADSTVIIKGAGAAKDVDERVRLIRLELENTEMQLLQTNAPWLATEGAPGRDFDLQELHINLISLSGHIDETDDELTLHWNA